MALALLLVLSIAKIQIIFAIAKYFHYIIQRSYRFPDMKIKSMDHEG